MKRRPFEYSPLFLIGELLAPSRNLTNARDVTARLRPRPAVILSGSLASSGLHVPYTESLAGSKISK
jgi:hypothetical protein